MKKGDKHWIKDIEARFEHQKKNIFLTKRKILALDYGQKFCGVAYSPDGVCVYPKSVFHTSKIHKELENLIQSLEIEVLVFGLPISDDGTENEMCNTVRTLAKKFENKNLEIHFENERASSQAVIKKSGTTERIDQWAAVNILEYFLNRISKK